MRVGIFVSNSDPQIGGGYTFEEDLIKAFFEESQNNKEHEFYIISKNKTNYNDLIKKHQNFKILHCYENIFTRIIENLKRHFFTSSFLSKFKGPIERLANKNKIEMIWFTSGYCYEAMDIPYIATVFDLQHRAQPWFPEVANNGQWAARELIYRYFLSKASYVIVGTEVGRQEVEFFYQIPKYRIHKLPHPTPSYILSFENKSKSYIRKKYNLPENFIFYPAQFWSHKNHINLLLAIKIIKEKYGLKLNLVLTGSDKGNKDYIIQNVQKLNLSNQIYILGFVPKNEMAAFYKSSSMLAYISLCGPENLPPLEAFSAECPVISSHIIGSEEQFGDTVLFCDPTEPNDIAEKIYLMLTNTDLKKNLIIKGIERAKKFNSKEFSNKVLKIINDFGKIRRNWN
jgi:glycosyltransferase involved in cell wall biosynthesis